MSKENAWKAGLDRNAANYTPLSPLSLLARSAYVYPSRTAVIHGERRLSWSEVYARCRRLASALRKAGVPVALELIGQASLLLGYAGEVEGAGRDADRLAFHRDAEQFGNALFLWTVGQQRAAVEETRKHIAERTREGKRM